MSKNGGNGGGMNDFVREAIREKAARDLAALNQRIDAFGGIERARDALHTASTDLTNAAAAVASMPVDGASTTKLKKLRKLVDDALALATELGDALGVDGQRDGLQSTRQAIFEALEKAGIEPSSVLAVTPGGDAQ
jgi:hypothetical protein